MGAKIGTVWSSKHPHNGTIRGRMNVSRRCLITLFHCEFIMFASRNMIEFAFAITVDAAN